jgi:hypothetical protein
VELTLKMALLGDLKSNSQSINDIIMLLAKMYIFSLQSRNYENRNVNITAQLKIIWQIEIQYGWC